ncbi:MAG: tetratricopeptide repeat protein [Phycisphaerae bacterium]|nr:tetratricopeptide repeat protein [Phycisphaerae bacterium]
MAKKVNKKVAIIGSVILALLIMAAIVVILNFSRDPQKYIADAQIALALEEPDYKAAEKAYGQAFSYAKKNINLKTDILFKLADMYIEMNDWRKAAGCWNRVINFDTKNLKARLAMLDYSYQLAMSGNWTAWKEVESNASELIERQLDTTPRMYRIKGQAILELVKHGQMTDRESAINDAIENLQKSSQEEPNNVDVYQLLADAMVQKGKILAAGGVLNAIESGRQEASKILLKGIENLPDEPKAYVNLYSSKIDEAGQDEDKIKEVESNLLQLVQKFPDSPLPRFSLVQLYQKNPKDIEKTIDAEEKARKLEKQNVSYAITAANLYYRKYLMEKDLQYFQKAIDIATDALSYPDSLDVPGPRARIGFINRYSLHTFLANSYLDRAAESSADAAKNAQWLELAEKEVHQIDQLLGSAENPYAIMWQGRIKLAKGQKNEAISQMYTAYQQLTAAGQTENDLQLGLLAYELAKALGNTSETGAVMQFYITALRNSMHFSKPEMILEFASVLIRMQEWKPSLEAIDYFEQNFGQTVRSRDLRISAYIGSNMLDKADELFKEISIDDPNILRFKNMFWNARVTRANWELIQKRPDDERQAQQDTEYQKLKANYEQMKNESRKIRNKLVETGIKQITDAEFVDMCKRYMADEEHSEALSLIDSYQAVHPNSINAEIYKLILSEPSPANVPPERYEQITVQVLDSIADPIRSNLMLGQFYQTKEETERAVEYYQKVLQLMPDNADAITGLFEAAITLEDFKRAQKITETVREHNIDDCRGNFFRARLAYVKEEYQEAVERINACLEERPVFSRAYLIRSQAYSALERENDAIDDAQKAYNFNPSDRQVTRNLAYMLYKRNQRLGNAATPDQILETRKALEAAARANPRDLNLQNIYIQFISSTEPDRAVAISQQRQKATPTAENSLQLGRIASIAAQQSKIQAQKDAYNEIALDAYKTAYGLAPSDVRIVGAYAEFLRNTGRPNEAEKIAAGQDALLWRFYIRSGKLDEAQKMLNELYEANPKDANVVTGLILVSRSKTDQAGVLKYSAELLNIDKTLDNQIVQIESYLEVGLADEAEALLADLRGKYPDDPRALFLQTWQIAKQGKLADALKLANHNLDIDKDNPRAWRLRGQINLGLNNYNEAIDDLLKSKLLRDNAEVRIDLARAYTRTGRYEQAIAELKASIEEQESAVARAMLEEIYYRTGKVDQLESFYLELIDKFPDNVDWYNRVADLMLNTQKFDQSYKFFSAAYQNSLKRNSEMPDANSFDGMLRALLGAKKYDQLLAEATKHLDGIFAPLAYTRMADAKAFTGQKEAAVQYFRRALEKAETNQKYIVPILREMNNMVGFEETVKWCSEKLQSQPDSLAINTVLFNLYNINEQYNKAIEYIDNCIRIKGDDDKEKMVYQFNKASTLLMAFNKTQDRTYLEKAIQEYESILQKQPTNISVLNNLAYIIVDNDLAADKALEYAERAYKNAPGNANILDTYGYVLLKNGETKKAEEIMQMALQQFEKDKINAPMEVYEHIAMVKESLGQNDEALAAYRRALEFAGANVSQEVKDRISAAIERLTSKM